MAKSKRRGQVHLIAGRFKGRKLPVLTVAGLRPSGLRLRETVFSWLMPYLPGCRCLDLFAGTGALGFEALSRGASFVQMVDSVPQVVDALRAVAVSLDVSNEVQIICQDARKYRSASPFDIVFLDPPFDQFELMTLLNHLQQAALLHAKSIVYVEMPKGGVLTAPWQVLKQKQAGQVQFGLYQLRS